MVTKSCAFCGTDIIRQAYLFRSDNQFCNNTCKMQFLNYGVAGGKKETTAKSIQTKCEGCGSTLKISHRQLVLETVHFCTTSCKKDWVVAAHGIEIGHRFAPLDFKVVRGGLHLRRESIFFQGEKYEINSPY